MKTKKNARVSLDKKRNMFFLVGLTFALGTALMAFEWRSDDNNTIVFDNSWDKIDIVELPPIDRYEPPKPKPQKKVTVFEIVEPEDETIEIDEPDFGSSEADENTITEAPDMDPEPYVEEIIPFVNVETKPEFVGGTKAFYKFINDNITYPESAKENNIEGIVYVRFTIDTNGKIINAESARPGDKNLDKEAVRIFKIMPKWRPGKQRGKAVKVSYILPINFKLS